MVWPRNSNWNRKMKETPRLHVTRLTSYLGFQSRAHRWSGFRRDLAGRLQWLKRQLFETGKLPFWFSLEFKPKLFWI
jgi:hypothetical protein